MSLWSTKGNNSSKGGSPPPPPKTPKNAGKPGATRHTGPGKGTGHSGK